MKNIVYIIIILLSVCVAYLLFSYFKNLNTVNDFSSRNVFSSAMEFVKREKPTPPVSAIFYAKVAEDIYKKTTPSSAKSRADDTPSNEGELEQYFKSVMDEIRKAEGKLPNVNLKIGNENNEYWVGKDPFSPKISQYERFLLKDFTYVVPPPPKYKSAEFYENLEIVKRTASNRDAKQGAIINYFGGVPGTETPSGIWQNILWENVKMDKSIDNEKYAYVQMILAKSLADAFMECWKGKYAYQTKRPNMIDKEIDIAMPNPPFPAYASGHSTISFTAAIILGNFFPEKEEYFIEQATLAKNSRLWAGIHFPYDNDEGQKLGIEVAKNILENI